MNLPAPLPNGFNMWLQDSIILEVLNYMKEYLPISQPHIIKFDKWFCWSSTGNSAVSSIIKPMPPGEL
jgi:hypothetical protein